MISDGLADSCTGDRGFDVRNTVLLGARGNAGWMIFDMCCWKRRLSYIAEAEVIEPLPSEPLTLTLKSQI